MKILIERPPVWDNIRLAFGIEPRNAVFTYGDKIYNPEGVDLAEYIIKHEELHEEQQGKRPDLWWGKYLRDVKFRTDQEARAYGVQFREMKKVFRDRNDQARILMRLGQSLSGPLYGHTVAPSEAMKLIKQYSI